MIGMSTINSIREKWRDHMSVAEIARQEGVSEPTVRKYVQMDDFSPKPPSKAGRPSILDPYKALIDSWLEEDRRRWHKQRHTARRVFDRLKEETDFGGGYTTVQTYVRKRKAELGLPQGQYLDLEWAPAEAQVDFGEADFRVLGIVARMFYLVVTFPHSNVGLAQLFWGQNAECVCEGLKAVFAYVGGVPRRLVFDNATGVGRKTCEGFRTTELFGAFAAHFGFKFDFCNPNSGHEKGSVENKVGFIRKNLFVPMPNITNLGAYNKHLLDRCWDAADRPHYRKGENCLQLFVEDEAALAELPAAAFRAVTLTSVKADKCGNVCLDGRHVYSADPALAQKRLPVELGAFEVMIYDEGGRLVTTHPRAYGDRPTDTKNPASQLALLCRKPGGWKNSQVRASLEEDVVAYVDSLDKEGLKEAMRLMRNTEGAYGYDAMREALAGSLRATGTVNEADVTLLASLAAAGREAVDYAAKVDMSAYDALLGAKEGAHGA